MPTDGLPQTYILRFNHYKSIQKCARMSPPVTRVIGRHTIHALTRGQTPVVVYISINALYTCWTKVQKNMELVNHHYGAIPFVL
jgi:hypothetical protein